MLRENQRFYFDKLLFKGKKTLDHLGELLCRSQHLSSSQDIRSLTWEEVQELVKGSLPSEDAQALVKLRQAQNLSDKHVSLPTFLRGETHHLDHTKADGKKLTGLGISPGRITGRVRILHSIREGARLAKGEILVTRATDPAWTPLFLTAGGLIMELGSLLSHGAVVAREYRVPAVVNISDATHILKDGQTITLDGDRGVIYLH